MPVRYLKPGIRDSEHIDSLSPLAETLFYRLIVTVDDFGRYDGRPSMVKAACFPIKESVTTAVCEAILSELVRADLISAYLVDGKPYIQVTRWDNVPRAKESKYPPCSDRCAQLYSDARKCIQMQTDAGGPYTDVSGAKSGSESVQYGADPTESSQITEESAESHGLCGLEPSCMHLYTDVDGLNTDVPLTETKTETETETGVMGQAPNSTPHETPPAGKTKKAGYGPPDHITDPVSRELWGKALPFDFAIPDNWLDAVVTKHGCSVDAARSEFEAFIEYWANGKGRKQTRLDWFKTWQVWCSKSYSLSSTLQAAPRAASTKQGGYHLTFERMRAENARRAVEEFLHESSGVTIDA